MLRLNWSIIRWVVLLVLLLLAFMIGRNFWINSTHKPEIEASVLLEQYKDVFQMVTNQGNFQEIYSYKDYWKYDISPLRKKALVRAKGKVLIGYDMDEAEIEVRESERMIVFLKLPAPQILALEVDMDYYDLEAGMFNAFTAEDMNKIDKDVKSRMRSKVEQSDLYRQAEIRKLDIYRNLREMAALTGWKVAYKDGMTLKALP
jgi:hypothetical protein